MERRIDLERHLFPCAEAEETERLDYARLLSDLESRRGSTAASASDLLHSLQVYDRARARFMRHYTYHYLRYACDTRDQTSHDLCAQLESEFASRTEFLGHEWKSMDEGVLDKFAGQQPALEKYRHVTEAACRYRPHTLPLAEEELLAGVAHLASEWQASLYDRILRRTVFESIETPDGELDVQRQRTAIASHPDRAVREAGFRKLYAGYSSHRDLYAFALLRLAGTRNQLAKMHHFEDAPSEVYFASYWTKQGVTGLLGAIGKLAVVYKRYQRLRADYAKRQLGHSDVAFWDIGSSLTGAHTPRFTLEQAATILLEALSPLGAEFRETLARLLDPREARMDVSNGDHRLLGGFSRGFPGFPSFLYSGGYEGYYNDVRILAHEGTHAIHRQLMNDANVLPIYAEGPHYLFESFAILSELLLADFCYQHEGLPERRRYYLEQFFDGKGMAMFFIAQDAELEQKIHEGVNQGTIADADDLDALGEEVGSRYSIWIPRHEELKMRWITNRLFYIDPMYNINYVYGALLALKYYELLHRDPEQFVSRYVALMKNGFNAPPDVLIRRFLAIEPDYEALAESGAQFLDSRINLLESQA